MTTARTLAMLTLVLLVLSVCGPVAAQTDNTSSSNETETPPGDRIYLTGTQTPTQTPTQISTNNTQNKTLVIMSTGEPASYTISVSGTLTANTTEPVDSAQDQSMTGLVGGIAWDNTTDSKDTIQYTGEITDFQGDESNLRIMQNGTEVSPADLSQSPSLTQTQSSDESPTETQRSTPTPPPTSSATPPSPVPVTDTESPSDSDAINMAILGFVGSVAVTGLAVALLFRHIQ